MDIFFKENKMIFKSIFSKYLSKSSEKSHLKLDGMILFINESDLNKVVDINRIGLHFNLSLN